MKSTKKFLKYGIKRTSNSTEVMNYNSNDFDTNYIFHTQSVTKKIRRANNEKMIDENISSEQQKYAEKFRRDRFMKAITYTLMKYYMVGHY